MSGAQRTRRPSTRVVRIKARAKPDEPVPAQPVLKARNACSCDTQRPCYNPSMQFIRRHWYNPNHPHFSAISSDHEVT